MRRQLLAFLLALLIVPSLARGQTPRDLLDQGIRAYQDLEFDAAVAVLQRLLEEDSGGGTDLAVQAEALAYLAASELFRGRLITATATFRRLVRLDPRYRPDQLVFPPAVTNLFEETRRQTRATRVEVPPEFELRTGIDQYQMQVLASSLHDVVARIEQQDGSEVRVLYQGPLADSLTLRWDGTDAGGDLVQSGVHAVVVQSLEADGSVASVVQVPLMLEVRPADTLAIPPPPADSLFLPERRAAGPGLEALVGGLALGTAIVALPAVFASGSDATQARFAVGGAVSLAGVIGFFARRPGQQLPQNAAANAALRQEWQQRLGAVRQENVRRRADIRLRIRVLRTAPDEGNRP